jgi:hypothetical protein
MTTISSLAVRGTSLVTLAAALALPAPAASQAPAWGTAAARERTVVVNRVRLPGEQIAQLERQYRVRLADGRYWYDRRTGAWGVWGGPALGVVLPGLDLGGPLPADASGGGTGVFVNGRELHPIDVAVLRQITPVVLPGRYWLDASGTGGLEGGPAYFNLYAMAAQARAAGRGGNGSWIYRGAGGGMGGDGACTYYIGGNTSASVGC